MAARVDPVAGQTCLKCTWATVMTAYHQGAPAFSPVCVREAGWCSQSSAEHLHLRCGRCGYDWTLAPAG